MDASDAHCMEAGDEPAHEDIDVSPRPQEELTYNPLPFQMVRMRLTGRWTPLRRRQYSVASSSSNSSGSNGTTANGNGLCAYDEEVNLKQLLDAATERAEQEHVDLTANAAWPRIRSLLPLLADAQAGLLAAEQSRCRAVEVRRGRASHVRFACYDLSAVEPPRPSTSDDATLEPTHQLLDHLSAFVALQRGLLSEVPEDELSVALGHFCKALHAEENVQQDARARRAAAWCAEAFSSLLQDRTLLFQSRLAELLGSLLRFYLHAVFDLPSRSALRAAEKGEGARELLASNAISGGRGAALRFYVPRAPEGSAPKPEPKPAVQAPVRAASAVRKAAGQDGPSLSAPANKKKRTRNPAPSAPAPPPAAAPVDVDFMLKPKRSHHKHTKAGNGYGDPMWLGVPAGGAPNFIPEALKIALSSPRGASPRGTTKGTSHKAAPPQAATSPKKAGTHKTTSALKSASCHQAGSASDAISADGTTAESSSMTAVGESVHPAAVFVTAPADAFESATAPADAAESALFALAVPEAADDFSLSTASPTPSNRNDTAGDCAPFTSSASYAGPSSAPDETMATIDEVMLEVQVSDVSRQNDADVPGSERDLDATCSRVDMPAVQVIKPCADSVETCGEACGDNESEFVETCEDNGDGHHDAEGNGHTDADGLDYDDGHADGDADDEGGHNTKYAHDLAESISKDEGCVHAEGRDHENGGIAGSIRDGHNDSGDCSKDAASGGGDDAPVESSSIAALDSSVAASCEASAFAGTSGVSSGCCCSHSSDPCGSSASTGTVPSTREGASAVHDADGSGGGSGGISSFGASNPCDSSTPATIIEPKYSSSRNVSSSSSRGATASLRAELSQLELLHLPLSGDWTDALSGGEWGTVSVPFVCPNLLVVISTLRPLVA